uniref:Uncharacterized protein n=1 Tax=Lynx canadensis TaxID=61383 RepID=A0A667HS84_LYNCA
MGMVRQWAMGLRAAAVGGLGSPLARCRHHLQASPSKKAQARQENHCMPPYLPLSPEQLVCVQRSKAAALLRLSWKKHLSTEFEKPYFIKLMGSVAEKRKHYTTYPLPHQIFSWTQIWFFGYRHFSKTNELLQKSGKEPINWKSP